MSGIFGFVSCTTVMIVMLFDGKTQAKDNTPPYITHPRTQELKIIPAKETESATRKWVDYNCAAVGSPDISYAWKRNGRKVSGKYALSFTNGSLIFPDFNETSNGMYQCEAQNVYGTALSDILYVYAAIPPIDKPYTDRTVEVDKGWGATLSWGKDVPETFPQSEYTWFSDSAEIVYNQRIGMDTQGNLHFAYTTEGDAKYVYYSALWPDRRYVTSMGIKMYSPTVLQLVDRGDQGDFAPEKVNFTQNGKAVIDKPYTFYCFFYAKPIAQITWKNTSNHVINASDSLYDLLDYGRKLMIKKVRQEDEGFFKCTGSNSMAASEVVLPLNVTSPPMRIDSLGTNTVPDWRNFTLECKAMAAMGENLDRPVWYRDGKPIGRGDVLDPSRYTFNEDMTELTITGLDKVKDTASYQCNVSNSEGFLWLTGYLRVIKSIVITKKPADVIYVKSTDTIGFDITVRSTGDQCCPLSTVYFFNETQLSYNTLRKPPFRYNALTNSLKFVPHTVSKDVLMHWMGPFACRVSNEYDKTIVAFTLTEHMPYPVVANTSTDFWWLILLCCIIVVLVISLIVLIIYKRNTPGDTYKVEEAELEHNLDPEEDLRKNSFKEF